MKLTLISILIFLLPSLNSSGQTRTITGKVIDEHLEFLVQIGIENSDTALLGTTDIEGKFKIEIPINTKTLIIAGVGYEWISINLTTNCDHLDIILMFLCNYDYISLRKVDKLRLKRFKRLPELHSTAFKKGIFLSEQPCYEQTFKPDKGN